MALIKRGRHEKQKPERSFLRRLIPAVAILILLAFVAGEALVFFTGTPEPMAPAMTEFQERERLERYRVTTTTVPEANGSFAPPAQTKLPEPEPEPELLNPIDPELEAQLWELRPTPWVESGWLLPSETGALVAQSGLRELIDSLAMPTHPTREEVAEALGKLGQVDVLTTEFTDGTTVTISVHFGITTAVRYEELVYDISIGRPIPQERQALLVAHPQPTFAEWPEDVPIFRLERMVCHEHPEMYLRAMYLVDYVVWEQTGYRTMVYELADTLRFFAPSWLPEVIDRNACYDAGQ